MRVLLPVMILGLPLVAGACSQQAEPEAGSPLQAPAGTPEMVSLTCTDGTQLEISYPEEGLARLTYQDRTYDLTYQSTGQGAVYSGQGMVWSSQVREGEEISTLRRDGAEAPLVECRRPAPTLAPAPTPSGMKPCISPDLTYGLEAGDAGMGHRRTTIRVQNTGPRPCQLEGYPLLVLRGDEDEILDQVKAVDRTTGYFGTAKAAVPILLQPRDLAYFDISWSVIPHESDGETTCPHGASVQVAPPGDPGGKILPLEITACGGQIEVTPFRVGQWHASTSTPSGQ